MAPLSLRQGTRYDHRYPFARPHATANSRLGAASTPDATTPADRTEKLTPEEVKSLAEANQAVADAQTKLIQAKAALQGTTEGIEQAHHANTDCGCYLEARGGIMTRLSSKGTPSSSITYTRPRASLTKKPGQ